MPASLQSGAYRLVAIFESSSSPDSWYRLLENTTGDLSCDCPAWIFKRGDEERNCPHTRFYASAHTHQDFLRLGTDRVIDPHGVTEKMDERWHGGLAGDWAITSRNASLKSSTYLFVETILTLGTGDTSRCIIGFANRRPDIERVYDRIAGWCGYAHAADIARYGGFPMAGQQPEHFTLPKSAKEAKKRLTSFIRMTEKTDLGDGLRPEQRAEATLQMFLGEELYAQLERNHFLDVPSYSFEGRVYRLRRDYPRKNRERRLRVFENGNYTKDFCIVRNQAVPEADWYLGLWLSLLSDELGALSVVKTFNVFSTHSDDYYQREEETIPALWHARGE